jgi:hypothetical protein
LNTVRVLAGMGFIPAKISPSSACISAVESSTSGCASRDHAAPGQMLRPSYPALCALSGGFFITTNPA